MVMGKNRHLYIVAGPNGSGKTTFVRRFLPYYTDCINFVNADLPRLIADEENGHLTVVDDRLFSVIERSAK